MYFLPVAKLHVCDFYKGTGNLGFVVKEQKARCEKDKTESLLLSGVPQAPSLVRLFFIIQK